MDSSLDKAIAALQTRGLNSLPPLAIVLGSGLGSFADEARDATAISYADIPGFPVPSVEGHAGVLSWARSKASASRCSKAAGTITSTGGPTPCVWRSGLSRAGRRDAAAHQRRRRPQHRMAAAVAGRDHRPHQRLRDQSADRLGRQDRFVPLTRAYDEALRAELHAAARAEKIDLHDGVYMWFSGPSFETPAEIRAARTSAPTSSACRLCRK